MHRFFCDQLVGLSLAAVNEASLAAVELDEDESHHALRVLRLEAGSEVELMDGAGRVATAVVSGATGSRAHARLALRVTRLRIVPEARPAIDLAVAAPKGSRLEEMTPQLSQLNVATLIPLRTARGVADPRPARLDRLQRAAIESAKQCGRARVMRIAAAATLGDLWAMGHDLRLIAAPDAASEDARSDAPGDGIGSSPVGARAVAARLAEAQRVLILIGPEGGWTAEELDEARRAGCVPWRLGPNVMRIETAAAAAAAIAGYLVATSRDSMGRSGATP